MDWWKKTKLGLSVYTIEILKTYHHRKVEIREERRKWYFTSYNPYNRQQYSESPTAISCLSATVAQSRKASFQWLLFVHITALQSSILRTVLNYNYIPINRYCKLFRSYIRFPPSEHISFSIVLCLLHRWGTLLENRTRYWTSLTRFLTSPYKLNWIIL